MQIKAKLDKSSFFFVENVNLSRDQEKTLNTDELSWVALSSLASAVEAGYIESNVAAAKLMNLAQEKAEAEGIQLNVDTSDFKETVTVKEEEKAPVKEEAKEEVKEKKEEAPKKEEAKAAPASRTTGRTNTRK